MARRKKHADHGGGHGWYVTFADLMGLLMSFFVVLVAFSNQDKQKLSILAGSMREAFGVQLQDRKSGVIERDGLPERPTFRYLEQSTDDSEAFRVGPKSDTVEGSNIASSRDQAFATAATTLRQALQDLPDYAEISRHILIEPTSEGLNLQLLDQDGRSMFADGSALPYERTRKVIEAIAPVLRVMPNRLSITGHTAASAGQAGDGGWALSVARAAAVRGLLADAGVPADHFHSISGRADTEPLFPDAPELASNRRVTIVLMHEAPPLPPGAGP